MIKLKNFNQFLLESKNMGLPFKPYYFSLPYSIPENRFENDLLKSNTSRKTRARRLFNTKEAKYSSLIEFLKKNSIDKVEKSIIAEINKVVKFINNNKLTGKLLNASFDQEMNFSKYLEEILENPEEDILFGIISTNLPFSQFAIRIDYDIYKNIPVFTFWHDGDLFYYYGVFTLESNDVLGSGETHTYITANEVIDYLFYDFIWRATFNELYQMGVTPDKLNFSESEFYSLAEADINDNKPIVNNYFDKRFVKILRNWIETGNPYLTTSKKLKFDYYTIPIFGLMSFPGDPGRVLKMSIGPQSFDYTVRLLQLEKEDTYLAIKFRYNEKGLILIESGEFSTITGWNKVDWKKLNQNEIDTLYFINDNGNPTWIKNLIN
jgi:hypothetical protein